MAEIEREFIQNGFVDRRRTQTTTDTGLTTPLNYSSVNTMRTQLNTANSTYYMLYALLVKQQVSNVF
jgi:hypothetical protein